MHSAIRFAGAVLAIALLLYFVLREGSPSESLRSLSSSAESAAPDPLSSTAAERTAPISHRAETAAPPPPAAPAHSIDGEVVGPLGHPVAGARVTAVTWPDVDTVVASTTSDERGRFSLRGLAAQRTQWILADAEGLTPGRAVASFRSGETHTAVYLRLWEGAAVFGRVTDPDGAPVAGAVVVGANDSFQGGMNTPECQTDADGAYRLEGLPAGRFALRVCAPGLVMGEHAGFNAGEMRVDFVLRRIGGVQISIEIEGLPELLATRATLQVYPMRDGSSFPMPRSFQRLRFDSRARLVLEGLIDAEWNLTMPELEGWVFEPRSFRFPRGESLHRAVYKAVQDGSTTLRGRLRRFDGTPLAREKLVCRTQNSQSMNGGRPGRATTDAEGRFEMMAPLAPEEAFSMHLEHSRYVLRQAKTEGQWGLHDPRYLVRHEGKATPYEEVELEAVESAVVTGKLVDPDGSPVPFQWIELQVPQAGDGANWFPLAYATSALDGSFRISDLHGTDRPLRLAVSGRHGKGELDVELAAGQTLENVVVTIAKTGSVSGTVLDAAGAPRIGAVVALYDFDVATGKQAGGGSSSVLTDRQGRYRFSSATPGGHKLMLQESRRKTVASSDVFEVKAGEEAYFDISWPAEAPPEGK